MWAYTASTADRRLLEVDVEGSLAHVEMLHHTGLLTDEELARIRRGLERILEEARSGTFEFFATDEDVHTAVERRLVELVGEVGGKLHTGRSRNDQVALDMRLYLRRTGKQRAKQLADLALTLADLAERHVETVVASYTHLQQAQAVSLGHHLLAYAWMAVRDRDRFVDLDRRLDESPLGAGASGGSSLPLDPAYTARLLGFGRVFPNSMDAVGSRDLIAEYVWCCAQAMVDLSRLAEELVLWATAEFGWVSYSDAYTTGSSALPHKKNPDVAELARGKAAAVIGNLVNILTLQKGLPLTYNRDLQQDKEAVFAADDILAATLDAMEGMLTHADLHPPAPTSWVAALDLAESLVEKGVPFREAHRAVGRLVARLIEEGRELAEATVDDLITAHPRFAPQDLELCNPVISVRRRSTPGAGSPESVTRQIADLRSLLS